MRAPSRSATPVTFSRAYPAVPSQIREIRADLGALLRGCPVADDAILCLSEMAANATLHSDSGKAGGKLTVHVQVHGNDYVRIEVDDDGGDWIQAGADDGRLHGLDIVEALASRWGTVGSTTGRTVWAQLDWHAR